MSVTVDLSQDAAVQGVLDALGARLAEVARTLTSEADPLVTDGAAHDVLASLVARAARSGRDDEVWLLLVGVTGAFPTTDQVHAYRRVLRTVGVDDAMQVALDAALGAGAEALRCAIEVVSDRPVVDVDFTGRHDLHTGIQRVVREVAMRWVPSHPLVLTAFTDDSAAMRRLLATEEDRVLRFGAPAGDAPAPDRRRPVAPVRVVPWRTCVVLPEVPRASVAERLRAATVANRVVAIGYDCIPVVSADTVSAQEPVKFVRYLSLLKQAHTVVAISGAVGEEFAGFTDMLPTQGLRGPRVAVCRLPLEVSGTRRPPVRATGRPRVLAVGSHDPRKNHLAVLHAAERLWSEGLDFSLDFVGGRGWSADAFEREIDRLGALGRPVRAVRGVSDEELWRLYETSRFSVFPSLHEGYGLPVAESLARSLPVITSDRGSTAEIAAGGGALTVDPLDDEALLAAMRSLLLDDALLERLTAEAAARTSRTWADYADELWETVDEVRRS